VQTSHSLAKVWGEVEYAFNLVMGLFLSMERGIQLMQLALNLRSGNIFKSMVALRGPTTFWVHRQFMEACRSFLGAGLLLFGFSNHLRNSPYLNQKNLKMNLNSQIRRTKFVWAESQRVWSPNERQGTYLFKFELKGSYFILLKKIYLWFWVWNLQIKP